MSSHRLGYAGMLFLGVSLSCSAGTKVFTMPTSAMEPTIREGEKFSVEMGTFAPSRGNVVIFEHEGILEVKRVIGILGDAVGGHDLKVFVNGKLQQESYVQHIGKRLLAMKGLGAFGPVTVPEGKLFVAGDNRDYSHDSRDPSFGLISTADLRGKPLQIVRSPAAVRVGTSLK